MAAKPPITVAVVRSWISEAAPGWPPLDENALREIAEACNQAIRQRVARSALPTEYEARLRQLRQAAKRASGGIGTVLNALPSLWREAEGFTPAAIEALEQAEQALRRLRPHLAARPRGGQPKAWGALAEFIADHIRLALRDHGRPASPRDQGPLAYVLKAAVNSVFGEETTTASAVAILLRRRWEARPEYERDTRSAEAFWRPEAVASRQAARSKAGGSS